MAFLPVYDHDLFISFSPVDNTAVPGQGDGWAEQFYKNLNLMLARRAGSLGMVDIRFNNREAGENAGLQNDTFSHIQRSAIFICLNSEAYAANEECKKELAAFSQKAGSGKSGVHPGDHSRIVHVLLNNVPAEKWQDALTGARAFQFHRPDGHPTDISSEEFRTVMHKLVSHLWQLLKDFRQGKNEITGQQEWMPRENSESLSIYLGEVADPLRITRNRVIAELKSKGFNVVTGDLKPDDLAGMELSTREALKKADLAVHLLNEVPGNEIKDHPGQWKIQQQTEWALVTGKPQMIWVPAETRFENISDKGYKQFLQSIEKGSASSVEYEFVRGNKSTLTHDIIDFAAQVKVMQNQKMNGTGKVSVMLDTHFCDQFYAIDLARTLLENNIQPYINPQEDDPGKNIHIMGERLSQVNKLIFLYGKVSKEWLRERMNAALELIITNHYPIREFFVYMAPPGKETNNLFIHQQFLKVHVVNNSKNARMNKNELQDFLKALNTPQE